MEDMPEIYATGQHRTEVLWRTLLGNTAERKNGYPAHPAYGPAFKAWIRAKLTSLSEDPSLPDVFTGNLGIHQSAEGVLGSDFGPDDYETKFSFARNVKLFLSCRGLLGLGSDSLVPSDSIWIIQGSRVPLLLRKAASDGYTVVGGAYLHGFMNGEALRDGGPFQDIRVV
jgi:hypothetical protein